LAVVAAIPARRISTCSGRLVGAAAAGRTMVMSPPAADSFFVILRFGADDGARAIGATDAAAAIEVRGRRRRPPGSNAALRGEAAACSLSDISGWRAGVLYPLAVVAAIPARRISTCSGRLVGAAAAGRTMVMSPPAADSFFVILRFGADDGARAIGATDAAAAIEVRGRRRRPPGSNAALRGEAAACSLSDISGWRAGVLYPLAVVAAIPARRSKQ
jgi:hypothetical protein